MIDNINADDEQDVTGTEINKPVLTNMLRHILTTNTRLFEHLSFHLACYLHSSKIIISWCITIAWAEAASAARYRIAWKERDKSAQFSTKGTMMTLKYIRKAVM